ncbi:MAG: phosphatase, partial [Enterobacteriaceae bacterium]
DAPHEWYFNNMDIWPRLVQGVGILRGIEANILNPRGEIDCSDYMRQSLDLVIAGFHEPVFRPQTADIHTEALINTMASGKVHIISHPGNPKFPLDFAAVAEAAREYQVALEINNSSFLFSRAGSAPRCLEIAKAVKQAGGWVSLGSDSHVAFTLGEFGECIKILEQIDFPRERILNVSPRRLLDFLEMRGGAPIAELAQLE